MKRLLPLVVWAVATAAQAVPPTIPFAGRLTTSSGPVSGAVTVTFQLFEGAAGGTGLWSETHPALSASEGLVFAELGSRTAFESGLFNGQPRYLELKVDAETLSPRLKLASVPYAFRADRAERLGSLGEGDVQRPVIAGAGLALTGTTLSLSSTGCVANSVWKYDGSTFSCAPDQVRPTPTAGAGIAISGGTVALSSAGCAAGAWWKYTGTTWECSPAAPATDIGVMSSGTLNTNRYSAAADLEAEGYLDLNAPADLLTRGQGDGRYLALSGGALTGALSVANVLTAASFQFAAPRSSVLSLPAHAVVGNDWSFVLGDVSPFPEGTAASGGISVNLPNGATVSSLSCVVFDNDATGYVSAILLRITNTGSTQMANLATLLPDVTADWQTLSTTAITNAVVDNSTSSYALAISAQKNSPGRAALRRCWVEYTTLTVP